MKRVLGRFAPWTTSIRLLVIFGTSAALIGAVSAVSLKELSMSQRLSTAPDSTVVKVGSRTVTLGQLRVAHRARVASFVKARSMGTMMAKDLRSQTPAVIRPGLVLSGGSESPLVNLHNLDFSPVVTEPASQYADAPADMRAFCSSAQASACLYLPPQQQWVDNIDAWGGWPHAIYDDDFLLDYSQCASEGGKWGSFSPAGTNHCLFPYPREVTVQFNPAANYRVSSTASCDSSEWSYQVDNRGAIRIQTVHAVTSSWPTGNDPWCVVRVTVGS